MTRFSPARSASLVITLFGAILNFLLTVQVLAAWRNLKWEPESEWEGSRDVWRVDGVKLVWCLLSAYFSAASAVCTIGFVGLLKNKPALVRFYRDYSIADFSFTTFFTLVGVYSALWTSVRTTACEQLSRQPELMRDVVELGLNLENCELWFERAVMVSAAVILVLTVIRLHFLLAVSHYYSHLTRYQRAGLPMHSLSRSHAQKNQSSDSLQRIYLLPRGATATATSTSTDPSNSAVDDVIVYAPVPLSSLPQNMRASATEAWIAREGAHSPRSHRHRAHQSSTGRISLPIVPGEGLLPAYEESKVEAK